MSDSKHVVVSTLKTVFAVYKLENIPCGKDNCRKCPHGPYWYAYTPVYSTEKGKRRGLLLKYKRIYIGKKFRLLQGDSGEIVQANVK